MEKNLSRRDVLAGAGTTAIGALAGCSGLPLLGGSGNADARNWMYEYEDASEAETGGFHVGYRAPSSLTANAEHLHPKVRDWVTSPPADSGLDSESVDWTVRVTDGLLRTPQIGALSGSFDADDAREAATHSTPTADAESAGEHDDFSLLAVADGQVGAYTDGLAVQGWNTDVEGLESVLDAVDAGDTWPENHPDTFEETIDGLELNDTLDLTWQLDDDGDVAVIAGTGYAVSGETTTVRRAHFNWFDEEDMKKTGEGIDALRDVSTTADGDLVTMTAKIDTDRTALNGNVFDLLRAPYE